MILGLWTDAVADPHRILYVHELLERHSRYVAWFGAAAATLGVLDYLRQLLFLRRCATASAAIHNATLDGVLRSPMRFFDSNPVGR